MGPKKANNDFRWTDNEIQLLEHSLDIRKLSFHSSESFIFFPNLSHHELV